MPKSSKFLIAKDIIKKELSELSSVSMSTLARMRNDVMVTTNVLSNIVSAPGCTLDDIVEITYDGTDKK